VRLMFQKSAAAGFRFPPIADISGLDLLSNQGGLILQTMVVRSSTGVSTGWERRNIERWFS
jgi:hypothetical protein